MAAVQGFWEARVAGDDQRALPYVDEDSRNRFLMGQRPEVRTWQLDEVILVSDRLARVSLQSDVADPFTGAVQSVPLTQVWTLSAWGWRLQLPDSASLQVNELLYGGTPGGDRNGPPQLQILPKVLTLQFLNAPQTGRFYVLNGTDRVKVLSELVYDERSLVSATALPARIEPGEQLVLDFRVVSDDETKELTSPVRLVFGAGPDAESYQRYVVYNHIGADTRALFGLSKAAAQALKHQDHLSPVLLLPPPRVPAKPR